MILKRMWANEYVEVKRLDPIRDIRANERIRFLEQVNEQDVKVADNNGVPLEATRHIDDLRAY